MCLSPVRLLANFLLSSPWPPVPSLGAAFPYFLLFQAPVSSNCTLFLLHPQKYCSTCTATVGGTWGAGGRTGFFASGPLEAKRNASLTAYFCFCQPSIERSDPIIRIFLSGSGNCNPIVFLVLSFHAMAGPNHSACKWTLLPLPRCTSHHRFHCMMGSHGSCR